GPPGPLGLPPGMPRPWGAAPYPPPGAPAAGGPFGPPGPPRAMLGPGRPPVPKGRVPGWLVPLTAALALVVGLLGGAIGAALVNGGAGGGTVAGGLSGVDLRTDVPLDAEEGSVAAVAQELLPSTVQILAEGADGGATGSGFVLDRQGHVVTNNHVVAGAADQDGAIQLVDSEGQRYDAEIVGRSAVYDLAVLYSEDARDMTPAALGSSNDLAIGEGVVAIGSPLGLTSTVTSGIVSAKNRPVTTGNGDESSFISAVQTDAAINPGNSGGPLVNLVGQVVGVNSAIATAGGLGGSSGNIGVGFAIPVEQVQVTADQILRDGEARYPVIGATVQTGGGGDGVSAAPGATVEEVLPDSPAQAAGLEAGDVITEIEGTIVTDGEALIVAIRTYQPGDTIELTLDRDGDERRVEVELDSEVG
ncbi:S1C family serine protease, partial [Nocardioides sp. CFH 31398]|uniref:S1C family serine protease n=1 Tax=Nocardioides sp. CFH 31398 TaxID=2919579 RepID=UPI001F053DE5